MGDQSGREEVGLVPDPVCGRGSWCLALSDFSESSAAFQARGKVPFDAVASISVEFRVDSFRGMGWVEGGLERLTREARRARWEGMREIGSWFGSGVVDEGLMELDGSERRRF